jgi:hypothetical protein
MSQLINNDVSESEIEELQKEIDQIQEMPYEEKPEQEKEQEEIEQIETEEIKEEDLEISDNQGFGTLFDSLLEIIAEHVEKGLYEKIKPEPEQIKIANRITKNAYKKLLLKLGMSPDSFESLIALLIIFLPPVLKLFSVYWEKRQKKKEEEKKEEVVKSA